MDRFWRKVERGQACWTWTAALRDDRYGAFWFNGRMRLAHRVAWEMVRGVIPPGMTLDHTCRNRRCVRVEHLEAVSLKENLRRGDSPSARNSRKADCNSGHPLVGENLYITSGGTRQCRACKKQRRAEWGARNGQ